ncbi:MAG: IS3 family transposase [Verrucomicrobia bacterium]|nr:IS3 family transposase [Verrucomicrobiota bacterium]
MTIAALCRNAGMSRQNFYKQRKARQSRSADEGLVKALVMRERELQPRLGGLKLFHMLKEELARAGVPLGRDRFFKILKKQGLLLEALPKAPRTTNSYHSLPVFRNLINELEVTGPNQVWVSDITYIRTDEDFVYLSLITDQYSHKIMGYHVALTLEAKDALHALEMALEQLPAGAFPIHHSDRGCQYCSLEYVQRLRDRGLSISMTEQNHCAENAMAERMNGILKQEYSLGCTFRLREQVDRAVEQAVALYNTRRPHRSLQLRIPGQVHFAAA